MKKNNKQNTMEKKLYHLTHPTNVGSIKENGLKCSEDGYIYLVEDAVYTNPHTGRKDNTFNEIACGQIFSDRYTAIEVDTTGLELEGYDEGEYICKWCYRVKTDSINPDRLTVGITYRAVPKCKLDKKILDFFKKNRNCKKPLITKKSRTFTIE